MFGFIPPHVDDSLQSYLVYSAFPIEVKFDKNGPIKSKWGHIGKYGFNLMKYIVILGMYSSILAAYDYQPYPKDEGPNLWDINILTGFSVPQLLNNLSVASEYTLFHVYPLCL